MPLPAALLPALLLGLLWPGAVRGRSPPGRLPAGPRQRRWDATLFARSVARLPAERRDAARDGDYLLGIKRLRRLYCNVGIGFHIQVLPDGRIDGIHSENRYSKPAATPAVGQVSRSAPAAPPLREVPRARSRSPAPESSMRRREGGCMADLELPEKVRSPAAPLCRPPRLPRERRVPGVAGRWRSPSGAPAELSGAAQSRAVPLPPAGIRCRGCLNIWRVPQPVSRSL